MFNRRQCWVPTWRGWLLLLALLVVAFAVLVRGAYPFLAVTERIDTRILVVEGWMPDWALATALAEFSRGRYTDVYVVGGAIEKGTFLSGFGNHAALGAATLERMGLPAHKVHPVPALEASRDRTYASAVALRSRLMESPVSPVTLNVVSLGAHARRTRLMYARAFGDGSEIGIVAVEDRGYDPRRWWTSSQGVRVMIGEAIAYLYARLFFKPPPQ